MKISKIFLFTVVCLALFLGTKAAEEEEYEDEVEPPKPARPSPVLKRGSSPRGIPKVTTTTQAPDDEYSEEGDDGASLDGDQETTTESNKRIKAGMIRPFRSNDDLLAALKRRRIEAKNGKPAVHHDDSSSGSDGAGDSDSKSSKAAAKAPVAGRRNAAPAAKATARPNRFANRASKPAASSEDISSQESNPQPIEVKPKSNYRSARRT